MGNPIDLDAKIREMAISDLKNLWGGRFPTWNEFKKAHEKGRIKTHKGIANQALSLSGIPKGYYILYGIITPWMMFLIPIISIILYFFGYGNGWVVFGCVLSGYFLYKVTFVGACYGIAEGAAADEELYRVLISNGAFVFGPTNNERS